MGIQLTGLSSLREFFHKVERFMFDGSREAAGKGAEELARGLQTKIALGQAADGKALAPLRKATLKGPIRRETDNRRRDSMGSNPLSATGDTARSIRAKKVKSSEWEVSSNTDKGDMILFSNAKGGGNGKPFMGNVKKAKRDPVQVSDKQIDIMEDEIIKVLDRMLNAG